ncbi:MAG: Rrf2 family transcriptional regulator [Candidatus Ruminococcus intestinipullorum]|nr:Rrf2 family transcriptional regulator [Candidatus Ruminococcus intestinipullorum]
MQISSRFTIAIHVLVCIETFKDEYKITSDFLASSVNVNPVVIRRLLQQLKRAGIISVARGSGGAKIEKPLDKITLLDIYHAVECVEEGQLFHFHENPNLACPVGRSIHTMLDTKLEEIQKAMEDKMQSISLQDILEEQK